MCTTDRHCMLHFRCIIDITRHPHSARRDDVPGECISTAIKPPSKIQHNFPLTMQCIHTRPCQSALPIKHDLKSNRSDERQFRTHSHPSRKSSTGEDITAHQAKETVPSVSNGRTQRKSKKHTSTIGSCFTQTDDWRISRPSSGDSK